MPNDANLILVSGTVRIPGQEHLYIEPQAVLVDACSSQVDCYATCQNPSRVQWALSRVLQQPMSTVRVHVERIGGGFGGKQDRPQFLAAAAAVASRKAGRPVKMVLEREADMVITGARHPFVCKFKAYCSTSGKIVYLEAEAFADGGHSLDLSLAVLEVFLFALDGCYFIENVKLEGKVCKSNRPSNTAFRGFGKPQATAVIESIIEQCASVLKIDADEMRQQMTYKTGDRLLSKTIISGDNLPVRLLNRLFALSEYQRRKEELANFNKKNTTLKRGIAFTVIKNNTGFDVDFMNQATAQVSIYHDGSVIVHIGGTEMGQVCEKHSRIQTWSSCFFEKKGSLHQMPPAGGQ